MNCPLCKQNLRPGTTDARLWLCDDCDVTVYLHRGKAPLEAPA